MFVTGMPHTASALLVCLLLASSAAAFENEPAGLGKLKFGMSPQQVEKLFPGKVRTLDMEHLGATPVKSAYIVRQVLPDQTVAGLPAPTNVELRYWKDKLWVIIVYYGANSNNDVAEGLNKQYGKPTISGQDSIWRGQKVQVNTVMRERWYAIADLALSGEAQKVFAEDMRKAQERLRGQQGAAPAAPPPAAAPKAPGAPAAP